MTRKEALANLKEMDPDYVVDVLDISARELIRAFPSKVRDWLASEVEDESEQDE